MIYFMDIPSPASSIGFPPFSYPGNSLLQPQNGFKAIFAMICPICSGSKLGWGVFKPGWRLCCCPFCAHKPNSDYLETFFHSELCVFLADKSRTAAGAFLAFSSSLSG